METFNAWPTWVKIAAAPALASGLLYAKYMVGHALTLMILLAAIAVMIGVAQGAVSKRKAIKRQQEPSARSEAWLPTTYQTALPVAQQAAQPLDYTQPQARPQTHPHPHTCN